jgi:hypothetical protein
LLAARYGADACCPVTVRRHLRTIAEDAFENVKRGEAIAKVTPFPARGRPGKPSRQAACGRRGIHPRTASGER